MNYIIFQTVFIISLQCTILPIQVSAPGNKVGAHRHPPGFAPAPTHFKDHRRYTIQQSREALKARRPVLSHIPIAGPANNTFHHRCTVCKYKRKCLVQVYNIQRRCKILSQIFPNRGTHGYKIYC